MANLITDLTLNRSRSKEIKMVRMIVMGMGIAGYIISRADPYALNMLIRWAGNVMGLVACALLVATIIEALHVFFIKEEDDKHE